MKFDICININILRACSEPSDQGGGFVHVTHVQEKRNPGDMPLIGRMWMIFLDGGSYLYGIFTKYDMIMLIEFL